MASHHELGKKGERMAQEYLKRQQYRLLHTNWRQGRREIDIIAYREDCLVFFEVKTRATDRFGWPEQAVTARKQRCLQAAAEVYLDRMQIPPAAIRFDVISITFLDNGEHELLHMEDAF